MLSDKFVSGTCKMKREIIMREDAVDRAALWIITNNKHIRNFSYQQIKDLLQKSVEYVVKHAHLHWEMNYSVTAGFTVFFMPEDENCDIIEILVDPCVSTNDDVNYIDL